MKQENKHLTHLKLFHKCIGYEQLQVAEGINVPYPYFKFFKNVNFHHIPVRVQLCLNPERTLLK